jgi:hypothetical protein
MPDEEVPGQARPKGARPVKGTAVYRSVPEGRLFFCYTADPIRARLKLSSEHQVQLQFAAFYAGNLTYGIEGNFQHLAHVAAGRIVFYRDAADLREYLDEQLPGLFDGFSSLERRGTTRKGARLRVYPLVVDDLPDSCGVVATSRVLRVNYRTLRRWLVRGLPVTHKRTRTRINREALRLWLLENNLLVTE